MKRRFVVVVPVLCWALPMYAPALTLTVTDQATGAPVAEAVVALDRVDPVTPVTAEIYQQDRAFHPKVLILPLGSEVEFPNRDNTQHHVYSFSPAKTFNIELYAGRPERPVRFDQPGIVELGCNIHDHMQAFILVTQTNAIGQSGPDGRVELPVDPATNAGAPIRLRVWHPRLPDNTQPVSRQVDATGPGTVAIELRPALARETSMDLLQRRFQEL